MKQPCMVLIGPTAVGKSSFLYNHLPDVNPYVISADSMQIYREFDIVTASPSPEERNQFPHACINELNPAEEYSVNQFLDRADDALRKARQTNRYPVVVGGTGLYLKTFLYGMNEMPPKNESFRQNLRQEAAESSKQAIHDRLKQVDPKSAQKIHPNDLKRTIRALEIQHETGQTKSELINRQSEPSLRPGIDPIIIGLDRPDDELRERIRNRVQSMIETGLVEEVHRIRREWEPSDTLKQAIGYTETIQFLEDEINQRQLKEQMVSNTVEFARKQRTWFRRFPLEEWYHPEEQQEELIDSIDRIVREAY